MVDHVEKLREVNRHDQRVVWGTEFVETTSYSMCEREEGRNDEVVQTEAILGG